MDKILEQLGTHFFTLRGENIQCTTMLLWRIENRLCTGSPGDISSLLQTLNIAVFWYTSGYIVFYILNSYYECTIQMDVEDTWQCTYVMGTHGQNTVTICMAEHLHG